MPRRGVGQERLFQAVGSESALDEILGVIDQWAVDATVVAAAIHGNDESA